jgi:hypothetical protein
MTAETRPWLWREWEAPAHRKLSKQSAALGEGRKLCAVVNACRLKGERRRVTARHLIAGDAKAGQAH